MNNQERENHLENLRNRDLQRRNDMNEEERRQYLENMRNRIRQQRNNLNDGKVLQNPSLELNIFHSKKYIVKSNQKIDMVLEYKSRFRLKEQ